MAEAMRMPRQGQSVESCILTQWLKKKGDRVEEGELLYSYETDKAAFDEPASHSGILLETFFEEGEEVPVLSIIAVIGAAGEDISEYREDDNPRGRESSGQLSENEAANMEVDAGVSGHEIQEAKSSNKQRISPRARKMAATLEIDTASLAGSGPNGRIIAADIEQAAEEIAAGSRLPLRKSKISSLSPGEDTEGVSFEKAGGAYTDTPLSNIRRIIADKMLRSLNNSAQLTHHSSADARKILQLRKRIKSGQEGQYPEDINLNDMLCFAIIKALQGHPDMNAHFLGEHVRRFKGVHLAIAVDTERGLMVPVLKNAECLSLTDLGQSLKDIAAACKNGSIDPDYLRAEEASFTVSNLGAMGVEIFTPVLNLPQCGIIGINAITKRPVDLGDDTIGFVPYVGISLTYDHRAVDGAPASRFLQTVCENIAQFDPNI